MKTAAAALFLLALVPVSASAESEYAACMKMQQSLGGTVNGFLPLRASRSYGRMNYGSYGLVGGRYDSYGTSYGTGYFPIRISIDWAFGENSQVLSRIYACRHLVKVKPPAYRVIGVKSPAKRMSTNVTGRKASERPAPDFLPSAN